MRPPRFSVEPPGWLAVMEQTPSLVNVITPVDVPTVHVPVAAKLTGSPEDAVGR